MTSVESTTCKTCKELTETLLKLENGREAHPDGEEGIDRMQSFFARETYNINREICNVEDKQMFVKRAVHDLNVINKILSYVLSMCEQDPDLSQGLNFYKNVIVDHESICEESIKLVTTVKLIVDKLENVK